MPSAKDALLRYEAGQTAVAISALTDSGNQMEFTGAASPWSRRDGFAPVIRPNGLLTGGVVTPAASGLNDAVDVSAGTAYIGGALVSWSAKTDLVCDRAVTTDTHIIDLMESRDAQFKVGLVVLGAEVHFQQAQPGYHEEGGDLVGASL